MRDKEKKLNLRQTAASRSLRAGSYSLAVCAIAVVIAVFVNMIAGTLPTKYTELDLSETALYSLSDYSVQVTSSIQDDVTVYHLTTPANENNLLSALLRRYADLNEHIRVVKSDPQISQIASKYTKDQISENSLIFVSDKRSKVVDYNSIIGYSEEAQMYAMYGQNVSPDEFSGEREITSALSYVTNDVLPKIYMLTGHGEYTIGSELQKAITSENIESVELDLTKEKNVPEDCACLLILSPDSDIAPQELSAIEAYWNAGGKLMLTTMLKSDLKGETPNLDALLDNLGLRAGNGFLIEGDTSMSFLYPNYLLPNAQSHEITDPIIESKYHIYFPHVREISVSDQHRSSLNITTLLTTSDAAFSRSDMENPSAEKAEGDVDGPFGVGYAVTENVDGETAEAVVYGTAFFMEDSYTSYSGNLNLFLNSLKWMCDLEENISMVETKALYSNGSLEMSKSTTMLLTLLLMLVIPAAILITGVVIFIVRKKR